MSLELLDHEEASIEETLHAIGEAALFGTRETSSWRAGDAPIHISKLLTNAHCSVNALVPAHARILVNAGLQARASLLALNELSYLLLQATSARTGTREQKRVPWRHHRAEGYPWRSVGRRRVRRRGASATVQIVTRYGSKRGTGILVG